MLNNQLLLQGATGYNLSKSLRFRSSASAYLSRTPSSSGNQQKFTISLWTKKGDIASDRQLISFGNSTTFQVYWGNSSAGQELTFGTQILGVSNPWYQSSTAKYRDVAGWYHIVIAVDTTQATASNRAIAYVNGVQVTSYRDNVPPSQNYNTGANTTTSHSIGRREDNAQHYDGYMTEIYFVDGQQLTASSFGETDAQTGVWKPKKYVGTYGTNGFYLPFSDNTSTTTLGYDKSGNSNNWTTNNISLTAGSTYDSMVDVPTMSALASNYAVMNPLRPSSYGAATLTEGNLKVSQSAGAYVSSTSTLPMSAGKWYWEVNCGTAGFVTSIGIASTISANGAGASGTWCYHYDGSKYVNGSNSAYGASYTGGDTLGFAFDATAGSLTCYKNGVSQGVLVSGLSAGDYYAFVTLYNSNNVSYNFGQRPFTYTPPTGFLALNTFNLPEPSIKAGNKHFNAALYTADTAGGKTITGVGFQPDFTWIKCRPAAEAHYLVDAVRGTGTSKFLKSNSTDAEGGVIFSDCSFAFASDGYTLTDADYNSGELYYNGRTYASWNWKANGTGSSNTAGSITSTVSANPTAGFSVVTYTGSGVDGATIGHGLGVAPKMIITKRRNTTGDWYTYHASLGTGYVLVLQGTNAQITTSNSYKTVSSSTYAIGTNGDMNTNGGTYVAYCFSEVAGYSKFGSYVGNGSTDGTFVHCGFRPKFVLMKQSSAVGSWEIIDTSRSPYNYADKNLFPNDPAAEESGNAFEQIDVLSNGFKLRSNGRVNVSGGTYIYAAFAENPMKYSLAR